VYGPAPRVRPPTAEPDFGEPGPAAGA